MAGKIEAYAVSRILRDFQAARNFTVFTVGAYTVFYFVDKRIYLESCVIILSGGKRSRSDSKNDKESLLAEDVSANGRVSVQNLADVLKLRRTIRFNQLDKFSARNSSHRYPIK